jgi:hypothetical protein
VNDDPKKASVTDRDRPVGLSIAGQVIAYVDGWLALAMAAFGLLVVFKIVLDHDAYHDADVISCVTALGFFAPGALLLGIAALGMSRRWKARWWVQAAAIFWTIVSIAAQIYFPVSSVQREILPG